MRLIDVKTFRMHEFFGDTIPRYAILSHRWTEEEVSFHDITHLTARVKEKTGWEKIILTCEQAVRDGIKWAWVDTCCINKDSSAELSEVINSMFHWYRDSATCYAHLQDVSNVRELELRKSTWFTRGWTLQELIAPTRLVFYGKGWKELGTRERLSPAISKLTSIPESVLDRPHSAYWTRERHSVAQRMSWAANRECTRVEDVAYCLLGLFDINMPLLYGEGEKAFARLQAEIFSSTDDHSLLAWSVPTTSRAGVTLQPWTVAGVFAPSPKYFEDCGKIARLHEELDEPSVLTKRGIRMSTPIQEESDSPFWILPRKYSQVPTYRVLLNCSWGCPSDSATSLLAQRVSLLLIRNIYWETELFRTACSPNSYSRLLTPGRLLGPLEPISGNTISSTEPFRTIFIRTNLEGLHHFKRQVIDQEPINFYAELTPFQQSYDCQNPAATAAHATLRQVLPQHPATDGISTHTASPPQHTGGKSTGALGYRIERTRYSPAYISRVRHRSPENKVPSPSNTLPAAYRPTAYKFRRRSDEGPAKPWLSTYEALGPSPFLGWNFEAVREPKNSIPLPVLDMGGATERRCRSYTGQTRFEVFCQNILDHERGFAVDCTIVRSSRKLRGWFSIQVIQLYPWFICGEISGYANIEDIDGSIAEADFRVGDIDVSVKLFATQSWVRPRGTFPESQSHHLHVCLKISVRESGGANDTVVKALQKRGIYTQQQSRLRVLRLMSLVAGRDHH